MFILITRNYNSSAKSRSCSFVPELSAGHQMKRSYFPLMGTALPTPPTPSPTPKLLHRFGNREEIGEKEHLLADQLAAQ